MHRSKCEKGDNWSATSLSVLWKDRCLVFVTLFKDEFMPLCELLNPGVFPFESEGDPFLRLDHRRFLF